VFLRAITWSSSTVTNALKVTCLKRIRTLIPGQRLVAPLRYNVNTGQVVSGINFDLPSGYRLTGRLVDSASQPVLGAGGHLEDPVQEIEYSCALGGGSSSTDGAFEFNVPAGLYDLGFCKSSQCHMVIKGKIIRATTSLGDMLFSEASNPLQPTTLKAVSRATTFETVVSGTLNCASDVTVTPDGRIYVAAVRSWHVYMVSQGGLSELAKVGVYSLQAGSDGNLYGYFHPHFPGLVYKITPSGSYSIVGTLPQTSCESTLAVAPNLDLWIGYNGCSGTSMTDPLPVPDHAWRRHDHGHCHGLHRRVGFRQQRPSIHDRRQ